MEYLDIREYFPIIIGIILAIVVRGDEFAQGGFVGRIFVICLKLRIYGDILYTKIFAFLHQFFLHRILKFRKRFFGKNWCKKSKNGQKKLV